jgi:calcineurin-like phosphoesterase family protein
MNETLIRNWNEWVKPMDTVYVLGDFAMGDPRPYLKRLYGDVYLIPGDHDRTNKWPGPATTVLPKIWPVTAYEGQLIVLCHYLMYSWPRSHHGSWLLHGHHHEAVASDWGKIMNVGADLNCFYPVSWLEVVEYMKGQPPNWNLVPTKGSYSHV